MNGCAVHYYDSNTQTEHIFGLGHLAMKAQTTGNDQQAIVRGSDILGLGIGKNSEGPFISLGWDHRRRIEILDKNADFSLAWPTNDFFNVRIGPAFEGPSPKAKNNTQESMP